MGTQTLGKVYPFTRTRAAVPPPSRVVELVARVGYVAKGMVHLAVGVLALQVALGVGGTLTDSKGALEQARHWPFGTTLLWIVCVGLLAYSAWRGVQAVLDPDHVMRRHDKKAIARRIGYGLSGFAHLLLAFAAGRLALDAGSSGGGSEVAWTATVMSMPFGVALIASVGAGIVAFGVHQLYRANTHAFMEELDLAKMTERERELAKKSGQLGLTARGVTFTIIGWFLIKAALEHDPAQAHGLGDALREVASQAYGPWLLGIVALGLAAYGVYCFTLARGRRFVLRIH